MGTTTPNTILVVGAGPVGLMTALELVRQGVRVRVIDARATRGTRSKATTLWSRQLELLARHGLAEQVIDKGARIERVTVSTPQRRLATLNFSELSATLFPHGVSLPQPEFENLLEAELDRLGVHIERENALVDLYAMPDRVATTVRGTDGTTREEEFAFVVGADGTHSTVRFAAGIACAQTGPVLSFAITDVPVDAELPGDALAYYFSRTGALGLVPMGGAVYRIALGVPTDAPALGRAGFEVALCERTGLDATIGEPPWESHFTVRFQHATRYACGRVVLAGDAAHTMSPAGGQGMNTGLQDAANLGWRLAEALHLPPDRIDATLSAYTAERRADVERVTRTSRLLTRLGADATVRTRLLRDGIALGIRTLPPLRRSLTTRVAQLATTYAERPAGRHLRIGDRLPQGYCDDWEVGPRLYHWKLQAPSDEPYLVTHLEEGLLPRQLVRALGKDPLTVAVRPDGHIRSITKQRPTREAVMNRFLIEGIR